jgi:hypothetical protein
VLHRRPARRGLRRRLLRIAPGDCDGEAAGYQACVRPQLGQPTVVETLALNAWPQPQL